MKETQGGLSDNVISNHRHQKGHLSPRACASLTVIGRGIAAVKMGWHDQILFRAPGGEVEDARAARARQRDVKIVGPKSPMQVTPTPQER